jgi:hypothetical protein
MPSPSGTEPPDERFPGRCRIITDDTEQEWEGR